MSKTMRHPDLPKPKTAHIGPAAHPFGPIVYAIVRHDGAIITTYKDPHEAIVDTVVRHDANDYYAIPVPIGSVPISDLKEVPGV